MFPFLSTDSDLDTDPKGLQRKRQLSNTAPGSCNRSLSQRAWRTEPSHKHCPLLHTLESLTRHAEGLDTIHEGPGSQTASVSSTLLLTPQVFLRQIQNCSHARSVVFINVDVSCSCLSSLQVQLKGIPAPWVLRQQGRQCLAACRCRLRKTQRLKIEHHSIMVITHRGNNKFLPPRNPASLDPHHIWEGHSNKVNALRSPPCRYPSGTVSFTDQCSPHTGSLPQGNDAVVHH